MKKTIKVVSILLLTIMLLSIFSTVFAAVSPSTIGNQINTSSTTSVQKIGGQIIGFIQVIGTVVAVAILVVLGIKYMMGSAEEKADYKKTLLPYVIGAILIFAASNVAQMIYSFAKNVSG